MRHMSPTLSQKKKNDMNNKEKSVTILCLGDKALREVTKEKTIVVMWVKSESLYMIKRLANMLCLKQ